MPVPANDLSCSPSGFESPSDEGRHLSGDHQGVRGRGQSGGSGGREGAETPPLPGALEEQLGAWNEVARRDGEAGNAEVEDRSAVPRVLVLRPVDTSSSAPIHPGNGRRREKDRGRARSHRPEPPPKVVVTVETQAKTFRCLVLPTDTWGHVCAMVQVRSLSCSLARVLSSSPPCPWLWAEGTYGVSSSLFVGRLRWALETRRSCHATAGRESRSRASRSR